MTAPVPEETNAALDLDQPPPGEHDSELPDGHDGHDDTADTADTGEAQAENAETSLDQPSQ